MRKLLTCCATSALLGLLGGAGLLLLVLPATLGLLAELDRQPVLRLLPGEAQTVGALELTLERIVSLEHDLIVHLRANDAMYALRFSGTPTPIQPLVDGYAWRILAATPQVVRLKLFLPEIHIT